MRIEARAMLAGVHVGIAGIVAIAGAHAQTITAPSQTATQRHALSPKVFPEIERALTKKKRSFKECRSCPEMVIVPAGEFMMGSPAHEEGHYHVEESRHKVTIARPFAVGVFDVTFDEWDACVWCTYRPEDYGWGRGTRPVINVSWDDAQVYLAWLSKQTGKRYRLLSEAEWEYAARAGSDKAYSWGNEIGKGKANCRGCGSKWDEQTAPVGTFGANAFGLYDMHGNVFQWVQDCYNRNYEGAPTDGSARTSGDCSQRMERGGSWGFGPIYLRSSHRVSDESSGRETNVGFRVARTLAP